MSSALVIVTLVLVVIGFVWWQVLIAKQNQADGVIATFGNLRMTPTELIEGYGRSAPRHQLIGLEAYVEQCH